MIDRAVARRYAEAFVNASMVSGKLEAELGDLKAVAKSYQDSPDFQKFLGSPEIGNEEKRSLLSRLFDSAVGQDVKGLLGLLLEWERIEYLPVVYEEAQTVAEIRQGIVRGRVTTAHPISSVETGILAQAAGKLLGKQVILERHVEPELIGGVRIVVGTTILDGSVQTRLKEVRRQLLEAKVT